MTTEQNKLILDNMALAKYIAYKYKNVFHGDIDEAIAVANLGLVKAVLSYSSIRGNFSTYAGRCMINEIKMANRKEKKHANEVSLSSPISEDSNLELLDTIEDTNNYIDATETDILLKSIISGLSEAKKSIAMCKLANPDWSQQDCATHLGLSRAYVSRVINEIKSEYNRLNR